VDSQLDEFKSFVRKYPGLKNDVRSGKATWQSIYEEWYLYGEDDSQWEKYKEVTQESNQSAPATDKTKSETKSTTTSNSSSATLSGTEMMAQAFQYLQKMDMNKVQQTMTTVQKFIQLFQTMQGGKGAGTAAGLGAAASQKQSFPGLFSKFDD
jgi:hypothetical protein